MARGGPARARRAPAAPRRAQALPRPHHRHRLPLAARWSQLGLAAPAGPPQGAAPQVRDHRRAARPACESALAVREALLDRDGDTWVVVLTDRDEQDLGVGITAHLAGQRLRQPDPWEAVRDRFAATRLDHRLVSPAGSRDVATGLLAVTPVRGWPPAPGGLLTRDHAFGAVAVHRLGLPAPASDVDAVAVLAWTAGPDVRVRLADLRALAGDPLADGVVDWLAGRGGAASAPLARLLASGHTSDAVPLGLVARAVAATPAGTAPRSLLRRDTGGDAVPDAALLAWAQEAEDVTRRLVDTDHDAAARLLARADVLLDRVEARDHAGESTLLASGLASRLAELGELLRRAAADAPTRADITGADSALVDPALLAPVERALDRVREHALAARRDEVRVPQAHAAVRLLRWLAIPVPAAAGLADHLARYRDEDAWVDRAHADAWTGVDEETLAAGLRGVVAAVRLRPSAHDAQFADALARAPGAASIPAGAVAIEDLLAGTVLPLARTRPVLLVVADGMSVPVATEVVDDVVRRYSSWQECLPAGRDRRTVALAVLPTVTEYSRASLLAGRLASGNQVFERRELERLATSAGVKAALFHKLHLDTSEGGFAVAHDVAAAVDDVRGTPLVGCVLNTIDDALDRSDPGGIEWSSDTVKHLLPLLERARRAGRVVVLTSDNGHVVERRQGRQLPGVAVSTNRWRPASGGPPQGDGEVLVEGDRVLQPDQRVVLAVDERLRYGPLKAGYHGGAAPAEVVVPVAVLAAGEPPDGWRFAPPQSPQWWRGPLGTAVPQAAVEVSASDPDALPTLFDEEPAALAPGGDLVDALLRCEPYREQRQRNSRVAVKDAAVAGLLRRLLAAPGHRLDDESAAAALGVARVQLAGALPQVQRLLNVEQYPVVSLDPDGRTVVLDLALLREQFGLPA